MTAARRPESQEQILEAAVASLTGADIPPAGQDGWLDPDADPPAELAVLPDAELAELLAAAPSRPAPARPDRAYSAAARCCTSTDQGRDPSKEATRSRHHLDRHRRHALVNRDLPSSPARRHGRTRARGHLRPGR